MLNMVIYKTKSRAKRMALVGPK